MPSKSAPSTATSKAAAREAIECARPGCDARFVPKRKTAKYHSATCRQRAGRQRKAVEHQAAEEAKTGTKDEHDLVKAVRLELETAGKVATVAGQLALQVARRIANPDEPGVSTLSKELRSLLAEAKGVAPAAGGAADPVPELEDDEVTKARKAREQKAREASAR